MKPRRQNVAFTLLEVSVSVGIVIILGAISVPVYSRVTQGARAASCMSNLRQLGEAVQLYVNEHDRVMPRLAAGRKDRTEKVAVIDNTLDAYARNPDVFRCPSDYQHLAETTGTSYFWNIVLSGQPLASLNFFRKTEWTAIPLLSDKDPFHPYTDTKVNILYADGHADKEIRFVTSLPSSTP